MVLKKLTAKMVRDRVDYNPETGEMIWKTRTESMFEGKKKGTCTRWNGMRAGKSPERGEGFSERHGKAA